MISIIIIMPGEYNKNNQKSDQVCCETTCNQKHTCYNEHYPLYRIQFGK